jgi:nucleoside-diphosphate-sugar epimerase
MRVAVLGAGGFIGNRCVEMFAADDRFEPVPIAGRASGLALAGRYPLAGIVADALDEDALVGAFDGCDAVVHAVAGGPATIVGSIAPVYRAAEKAGVEQIVYLSSASVHGQAPTAGTTESSPLSIRQPLTYNSAKIRAERKLAECQRQGSVRTAVLRPGIVHGPRSQWIGRCADRIMNGSPYLVGRGEAICNGIYIDNLVQAISLCLRSGTADGTYIVGDEETYTWADLLSPVARALGAPLVTSVIPTELPADGRSLKSAAKTVLRRLPRPLLVGLRAAYREFRGAGRKAAPPQPQFDADELLLAQCEWKLPHDRARQELGYLPAISLAEAVLRTNAWLAFAGYPAKLDSRRHWEGTRS